MPALLATAGRIDPSTIRLPPMPEPLQPEHGLLTREEAAEWLRISVKSLYTLTAPRGPITPTRIGGRVLFSLDSLRDFVRKSTANAGTAAE